MTTDAPTRKFDYPRRKLDLCVVLTATASARNHLEWCRDVADDRRREERLKRHECVRCFYAGRYGGSMVVTVECAVCAAPLTFGNTCADLLCEGCARERGLCRRCGADMDLKNRRKLSR